MYSSSSSTSRYTYDVFLSFRGKDTRKNFTDHLYLALTQSGVHTFRNDYDLPIGNDITSEIAKAIQDSRVSIIVFSKNYASSSQCLDELANILDSKDINGHFVVPVYYNVDPADVREQIGTFGRAFARHEDGLAVDMKRVKRWRDALAQAADLSGWDLCIFN